MDPDNEPAAEYEQKKENKNMDGIIFDVDGTLWDSTDSVTESWNLAIRENSDLDLTITAEILKGLFGKTMTEIANALFPSLPEKKRMEFLDVCYDYENRHLETHPGELYEGVVDTLQKLAKKYPLYIVSNCQCGYIEVMIKTSGIGSLIRDHLCFGETGTPKSETIRALMERNGLKDVVYVGDTQGDADACKAADVPFVFAEYGFGDVPDAEDRISKISELCGMYL